MPVKTQGTQLYTVDPADNSLIKIPCVISLDSVGGAKSDIDITPLEEVYSKQSINGLEEPSDVPVTLNIDPAEASHRRLYELFEDGVSLPWTVGFSDGFDIDPVVDAETGDITLATTRTWISFNGEIKAFPFNFQSNSVVQVPVSIKRSGKVTLVFKE